MSEPLSDTHILLIDCTDEKGLVHKITGALLAQSLNITSNQEFVDPGLKHFFMRTEFTGAPVRERLLCDLAGVLPPDSTVRLTIPRKSDIVILVTREAHCLGDLLVRQVYGDLAATIRAVIGNHPTLEPLATRFDIPFHLVSHMEKTREEHEKEVLEVLRAYRPEFLVLAKYMRVLTSSFIKEFPHRIINIHHSFLPAFAGASPYRQAAERGVKIIGATAHFVTEELDEGPIIAQGVIPVDHSYSAASMAQAGRDVETAVLARALRLVFEERVFVMANRTVIFP